MARGEVLFVVASLFLLVALIGCGISFFAPYWLGNVLMPNGDGGGHGEPVGGAPPSYILEGVTGNGTGYRAEDYTWRGLWAQCSGDCQWFWEFNYKLQYDKFTPLRWHLATQVLYFIGAVLVLFSEIYARVQQCCQPRHAIYRSIGFILLSSFVMQAAAVAVFGGFANRDYGATAPVSNVHTFLGWAFWMAVAGGIATLISGILFLLMDWVIDFDDDNDNCDK